MTPELHPTLRRLDHLATRLSSDPSVAAVLGLGSAGEQTHRFDDHSDIDFFVVVDDAPSKARYLATTDWLAGFGGRVVFDFANDPNGRKALFADGLFLEYAVFTPGELEAVPVHGVRVVWSRAGFRLGPAAPPPRGSVEGIDRHLHEALANLYVGLHRELRGERLAATRFIQVYAVDQVLFLARLGQEVDGAQPDPFDASRRVEDLPGGQPLPLREMVPGYDHNAGAAAAVLGWLCARHRAAPAMVAAVEALIVRARSR